MEYLLQLLASLTGDSSQTRWLFAASIGVAITVFCLGILVLVSGVTDPLRRRMRLVTDGQRQNDTGSQFMAETLAPISPYFLPKNEKERSKIRARLIHAGYRSSSALTTFYATKMLLALALGAAVLFAATFFPRFTLMQVSYAALFASGLGILLPNLVLGRQVEKRKRRILNGFPDALDLLVVCTEAGLGLNAALERVAGEIQISYPDLAEELALVNVEIRAGVDRVEALRSLADRTGLGEIRGLVSLLSQSLRFGTSVAESLRIYSEEFRDKRMQRAEEQAAKIGTKMIFPLVFCMFPAFFIVAVGPAVLGVLRVLETL